jgi:hypothetical protein
MAKTPRETMGFGNKRPKTEFKINHEVKFKLPLPENFLEYLKSNRVPQDSVYKIAKIEGRNMHLYFNDTQPFVLTLKVGEKFSDFLKKKHN